MTRLGWLMPPRIKPIESRVVARALVALAKREEDGARIIESRELSAVAAV